MTAPSYTVGELALAARCPRQLVLHREEHHVRMRGESGGGVGKAAHALAARMVRAAWSSSRLVALLAPPTPDETAVREHLYTSTLGALHDEALALASASTAADLSRLDGVVRSLAMLLSTLLVRARHQDLAPADIPARVLSAVERDVVLELEGGRVVGRLDLVCEDVKASRRWLWELKTFPADGDPAAIEQARLYALALAQPSAPAVLHVTGDRIEIAPLAPATRGEVEARLRDVAAWLSGAVPPPKAASPSLCERCSVQAPCWARWGRTLGGGPALPGPVVHPVAMDGRQTAPAAAIPAARAPLHPEPLWLGQDRHGAPVVLPPAALSRHMAVVGTTGSGKTWLAKIVIEEAALAGVPVLVFDVQGDLVQLLALQDGAALPPEIRARQRRFAEETEVRVFTPASDLGRRISLNPLIVPPPGLPDDRMQLAASATAESVVALCRTAPAWRPHAVSAVAEQIVKAARRGGDLSLEALADLVGEDESLKPAERAQLGRDLGLLTRGKYKLLYQQGAPLVVDELLRTSRPGRVPINVVYLSTLGSTETKQQLVAGILSRLYAWMLGAPPGDGAARLLLMLDEVGPYMPPLREPPSKEVLKRLFQEGRKYGVAGLFCTQNFTNVDYKVLAQANTRAIGKLGSTQDQKRALEMFPAARPLLEKLGGKERAFFLDAPEGLGGRPALLAPRPLLTVHGPPWNEEELARRLG